MNIQWAQSQEAKAAFEIVKDLQRHLVEKLDTLAPLGKASRFQPISWLRTQGLYGGGMRFAAIDEQLFNRASVNISQVQYENDPSKRLASASALSSIIHPRNPFAPSMHIHVSWTEMKSGSGYWRIMADLNPSIPHDQDREIFQRTLSEVAGDLYPEGREQGDQYFYIPALGRHRGVAHFYLEEFGRSDREKDREFVRNFGMRVMSCYASLVEQALTRNPTCTETDLKHQLSYHTLYFLQVLTLDRGTTSGLLVHDENDTGILGSLPSHVDKSLLASWLPKHSPLQQDLLQRLILALPPGERVLVNDEIKVKIAEVARGFYKQHPEAQDFLARGKVVPPTVANHL